MSVRHHPDETLLTAYAAGSLDEAMSLILAAHLSFCPHCAGIVARSEMVGGVLLEQIKPVAMAPDALAKTLARLDASLTSNTARDVRTPSNDNTPAPLRDFLGKDLSHIRWRKMGPKLGYVNLRRRGGQALRLLRGAPGSDVGQHSHRGMEYTLVLKGGFSDETGSYGPGDFQIASPDIAHNPIADPGEDCINLSVTTGALRFDSAPQKIVAWLFGF